MAAAKFTSKSLPILNVFDAHDNHDLVVICKDGIFKTFALFLASICPVICEVGKAETDISLCLPDFSVEQIQLFLKLALSNERPKNKADQQAFTELLDFLCSNYVKEPKIEEKEDLSEDFYDDWDAEEDEDYEEYELITTSKKTEINEEVDTSYDIKRGLYICQHCGTERKTSRSIQQHLSWHKSHPNEDFHKSHKCQDCGKICADHSLLRAHKRLVHSPRIFACSQDKCDKSFKSKEGLKQHLLVHSGVKNFQCTECGYRVRTKHHLKLHTLKRHTDMKKTIPCEVCGKLFRHISNLKCHFYTHKARQERQHRCEICSLTFRTQKSLDSHLALHDPSRPFKCSKCPLRYKNKDALVAHENTHQNLQYKCQFCDISYTRKDNLKRHVKEKHS